MGTEFRTCSECGAWNKPRTYSNIAAVAPEVRPVNVQAVGLSLPNGETILRKQPIGGGLLCEQCAPSGRREVWLTKLPDGEWSLPATVKALRDEADRLAAYLDAVDRIADIDRSTP